MIVTMRLLSLLEDRVSRFVVIIPAGRRFLNAFDASLRAVDTVVTVRQHNAASPA